MFNAWLPESSGGDTLAPMPSATDLSLRAGDDARQRAICQSTYLVPPSQQQAPDLSSLPCMELHFYGSNRSLR